MPGIVAPKVAFQVGANTPDSQPSQRGNQIIPMDNLSWDPAGGNTSYLVDYSQIQSAVAFGAIEGILVNNQNNPSVVTISYPLYNYSVAVAPFALAWLPVELQSPAKLTVSSAAATGAFTQITAMNYRPDPAQFAIASGGQSPAAPMYVANVVAATTRTPSTVPMTGASVAGPVANAGRKSLLIQALSTNAQSVWINFTNAAVSGTGIELLPGEKFILSPDLIDQSAVFAIGNAGDSVNFFEWT